MNPILKPDSILLSSYHLEKSFRRQRKKIARKLGNPRILQIHCHTFRHWKATTEYTKTKNILYVQKLLGHKKLETTLRYTQLVEFPHEEHFICKFAKTVKEASDLIENGFIYVTDVEDCKLFKKCNITLLGM